MNRSAFIKVFLGALAAVSFLGSFVLTVLALLIPLRPYAEPELRYIVDDDCACFIFVSCFLSTFLLGMSLVCLKFGKFGITKSMVTKLVYMFWIVVTMARMFYVLPYYHG